MQRVKAAAKAAMLTTGEVAVLLGPALVLLGVTWQAISRHHEAIVRFVLTL